MILKLGVCIFNMLTFFSDGVLQNLVPEFEVPGFSTLS